MALLKADREKCWAARDLLWNCMDEKLEKHQELCKEFRSQYEKSCPSQWVKHFDRKREYLKFKAAINNEGQNSADNYQDGCLDVTFNSNSYQPTSNSGIGSSLLLPHPIAQTTSRSTSSVPSELNRHGKYTYPASNHDEDHRTKIRVIRKFPSLPSI